MAPSFSVADLKSRASKAKDLTASKLSDTRDRYSSTSSKNLDVMNPDYQRSKPQLPPAPPARPAFIAAPPLAPRITSPAAPPTSSHTKPDTGHATSASPSHLLPPPPARRAEPARIDKIDWANLSAEDKAVFFDWLDEFFARYLNKPLPTPSNRSSINTMRDFVPSSKTWMPSGRMGAPPSTTPGPPKIATWSKPQLSSDSNSSFAGSLLLHHLSNNSNSLVDDLIMTYPPRSTYGSAAADIAHYFSPSVHWDNAWYITSPPSRPPFIAGGDNWIFSGRTSSFRNEHWYGVICRDLSLCWVTVEFSSAGPSDPNKVKRNARYLPCPKPLDRQSLIDAHETYGETIALFAESYVESRQYCGTGECWDLAAEALKYFEQFDYVPQPIPSISQTHGHLVVWFRAENGKHAGKWFGGDDRVRRGDIVQWRSVKIMMDIPGGSGLATLGAPDHTSIVVSDTIPYRIPKDGESLRPDEFGRLDVVEQSISTSILPKSQHYEMKGMDTGEVWIYRPVGMKTYLGTEFAASCPEDINALVL